MAFSSCFSGFFLWWRFCGVFAAFLWRFRGVVVVFELFFWSRVAGRGLFWKTFKGAQSEGFVVKSQFWKWPFLEGLLQLRLCSFKELNVW